MKITFCKNTIKVARIRNNKSTSEELNVYECSVDDNIVCFIDIIDKNLCKVVWMGLSNYWEFIDNNSFTIQQAKRYIKNRINTYNNLKTVKNEN